jgi:hypothetical protein
MKQADEEECGRRRTAANGEEDDERARPRFRRGKKRVVRTDHRRPPLLNRHLYSIVTGSTSSRIGSN